MDRQDRLRLIADDNVRDFEATKGGDKLSVKVTDDGRYRAEVKGSVSSVNHGSADNLLKDIARVLGGDLKITRAGHALSHLFGHRHEHTH